MIQERIFTKILSNQIFAITSCNNLQMNRTFAAITADVNKTFPQLFFSYYVIFQLGFFELFTLGLNLKVDELVKEYLE